jgi:hypothetical protein
MALVKLVCDVMANLCYVVPHARNPRVGNAPAAAGPMVIVAMAALARDGVPQIRNQLLSYSSNDVNVPSGFFDVMPAGQRDAVLGRSIEINVAGRPHSDIIELSAPVRGRNISEAVAWNATDDEVASVIERLVQAVVHSGPA